MTTTSASSLRNRPPAKMGRPRVESCQPVMVRMREPLSSLLDEWIGRQIDRPTRPEALRRLAVLSLAAFAPKAP